MARLLLPALLLGLLVAAPYITDAIIAAIEKKYGVAAKERFLGLNAALEALSNKSDLEKLQGVNDLYNRVSYTSDMNNFGMHDYWATPLEFLGRNRGDCEDYVIAKYFALRHLGIPSDKLYFSYVKSLKYREAHMVLTYFPTPKAVPLVLDNYEPRILSADQRKDLIPVYNFNGDALFLASRKGEQGKAIERSDKTHKQWDLLIDNIKRNLL